MEITSSSFYDIVTFSFFSFPNREKKAHFFFIIFFFFSLCKWAYAILWIPFCSKILIKTLILSPIKYTSFYTFGIPYYYFTLILSTTCFIFCPLLFYYFQVVVSFHIKFLINFCWKKSTKICITHKPVAIHTSLLLHDKTFTV